MSIWRLFTLGEMAGAYLVIGFVRAYSGRIQYRMAAIFYVIQNSQRLVVSPGILGAWKVHTLRVAGACPCLSTLSGCVMSSSQDNKVPS